MAARASTIHLAPCFSCHAFGPDYGPNLRQVFALFRQHLEVCRQDAGYHLTLPDSHWLRAFLAVHGEEREFVRDLVAAGRLQLGGSYHQPCAAGLEVEGMIRDLQQGRRYVEELRQFARSTDAPAALPEMHLSLAGCDDCPQLPQIATKMGFQASVCSPVAPDIPPLGFAIAPDGSQLLQMQTPCRAYPDSLDELLRWSREGAASQGALAFSHHLVLLSSGRAGLPDWLTGSQEESAEGLPPVTISTPQHYLAAVKPEIEAQPEAIPLIGRALPCCPPRAARLPADLEIVSRRAENRLLDAEKWATLAALAGARYPDAALDKAWRLLLSGQHCQAVAALDDRFSFLDLMAGYREALELTAEVEERAQGYIAERVQTDCGPHARQRSGALVVFNALGWRRTDICRARVALTGPLPSGFELRDDRGRQVAAQLTAVSSQGEQPWAEVAFLASDVPSLGYRTFYLAPARGMPPEAASVSSESTGIENEHFAVRADPAAGGGLVSIYDKKAKRELLNPALGSANELIAIAEQADQEPLVWELAATHAVRSGARPADVSVHQGPVFSRLSSELPGRCQLKQQVILYRGLRRVDLRTTLEGYQGERELLALSFPLAVAGPPTFGDRGAAVVGEQGPGLRLAHSWLDIGPALSLAIMDGARPVGGVPLGPCVIITSGHPQERAVLPALMQALLSRGITCIPRPDTEDPEVNGPPCAFRLSLGRGNAYSRRVLASAPMASDGLERMLNGSEWAGVLLAGPAGPGQEMRVPVLVADTASPEGMPRLLSLLARAIQADRLQIPASCDFSGLAKPKLDYGLALLNRGTPGAGLSRDGTLIALLRPTAGGRACQAASEDLAPRAGSHVFEHALLPHPGDWRAAGVVRAGYEFNHPLRAVQVACGEAPADSRNHDPATGPAGEKSRFKQGPRPLPSAGLGMPTLQPTFSLVSVDAPDVIITAVRLAGSPATDQIPPDPSAADHAVLIRLYEAVGKSVKVRLAFGAEPRQAWLADLTDRKTEELPITRPGWRVGHSVRLRARRGGQTRGLLTVPLAVPSCGIITVAARLAPLGAGGASTAGGPTAGPPYQELGPVAEPCSPLHCRYWDHNLGVAPIGNQPVTLWLRGPIPVGKNTRFTLGLSNDYRDREISGRVRVIAPQEWPLLPREVPYRIAPGSQAVYEVMVVVPPDASPCFLRAVTEDGDRVLQDVIPIGDILPLASSLRWQEDGLLLEVRNPNPDFVEGQAAIITPVASWGGAVDSLALAAVTPRLYAFRLEPAQQKRFAYRWEGARQGLWAVAKVMWYGNVQYTEEAR